MRHGSANRGQHGGVPTGLARGEDLADERAPRDPPVLRRMCPDDDDGHPAPRVGPSQLVDEPLAAQRGSPTSMTNASARTALSIPMTSSALRAGKTMKPAPSSCFSNALPSACPRR
jgi:hypothetical protein